MPWEKDEGELMWSLAPPGIIPHAAELSAMIDGQIDGEYHVGIVTHDGLENHVKWVGEYRTLAAAKKAGKAKLDAMVRSGKYSLGPRLPTRNAGRKSKPDLAAIRAEIRSAGDVYEKLAVLENHGGRLVDTDRLKYEGRPGDWEALVYFDRGRGELDYYGYGSTEEKAIKAAVAAAVTPRIARNKKVSKTRNVGLRAWQKRWNNLLESHRRQAMKMAKGRYKISRSTGGRFRLMPRNPSDSHQPKGTFKTRAEAQSALKRQALRAWEGAGGPYWG